MIVEAIMTNREMVRCFIEVKAIEVYIDLSKGPLKGAYSKCRHKSFGGKETQVVGEDGLQKLD